MTSGMSLLYFYTLQLSPSTERKVGYLFSEVFQIPRAGLKNPFFLECPTDSPALYQDIEALPFSTNIGPSSRGSPAHIQEKLPARIQGHPDHACLVPFSSA
jgi:hypothetical protein